MAAVPLRHRKPKRSAPIPATSPTLSNVIRDGGGVTRIIGNARFNLLPTRSGSTSAALV